MSRKSTLELAIERIRTCGFWFVDIPRTSSSSIRAELGKAYGPPYGKANLIDRAYSTAQVFQDHLPAIAIRQALGPKLWEELFTFSIVRNPWDRVVSIYHHRKRVGNIPHDLSFRNYVVELGRRDWGREGSLFEYHWHYYGSAEFLCSKDGQLLVDYIGRFEDRANDLAEIRSRIGVTDVGHLKIQCASPSTIHYSQLYQDDLQSIVGNLYKKDIELFEYEFQRKP